MPIYADIAIVHAGWTMNIAIGYSPANIAKSLQHMYIKKILKKPFIVETYV